MIHLEVFVFNSFQENTYLLYDDSGKCIITDPGMSNRQEQEQFSTFLHEHKLTPEAILNTHCHVDHILGCKYIKDSYGIPFYFHQEESRILEKAEDFGAFLGLEVETPPPPDKFVAGDAVFYFGNSSLKLLHVPGHSPGSIALYSEADRFVITGDALFNGSIGRTDLPGGDYATLIASIQTQLMTLPRNVRVFPGHGPSSTIGQEYDTNPFLN